MTGTTDLQQGLDHFRKSVNQPEWVNGSVPITPSLEVEVEDEEQQQGRCLSIEAPFENVLDVYEAAEQSQVGTAEETVYRLDARKSREFPRVRVLNEDWEANLQTVCKHIKSQLCPGADSVTPELYKLLIYTEGDFFNRHQDAQLSDNMFASLLFFLPAPYEGVCAHELKCMKGI